MAGWIAYSHYRNGFTDKPIDSHVIEVNENGEDMTVTTHTGLGRQSYSIDGVDEKERESVEERLKQLTNLYVQALISKEEYEQKKKEILDEL